MVNSETAITIQEMHAAGRSVRDISRETGMSYQRIYRELRTSKQARYWSDYMARVDMHESIDASTDRRRAISVCSRLLESGRGGTVIVDIDETAIDNGVYMRQCGEKREAFPEGWPEWVAKRASPATPEIWFLYEQNKHQYRWIFVSSRDTCHTAETADVIWREYGTEIIPDDILCVGDAKRYVVQDIIRSRLDTILYIDDQILPVNLYTTSRVIFPNYVYGAHSSYQKGDRS
jgi:hypothetical protein